MWWWHHDREHSWCIGGWRTGTLTAGRSTDGAVGYCQAAPALWRTDCSNGKVPWAALGHQDGPIPWGMGTGKNSQRLDLRDSLG